MHAIRTMRTMKEPVTEQLVLPPAQGEDEHLSIALANSAIALPGGASPWIFWALPRSRISG